MKNLLMTAAVSALMVAPAFAENHKKMDAETTAEASVETEASTEANTEVTAEAGTDGEMKTEGETEEVAAADTAENSETPVTESNDSLAQGDVSRQMDYANSATFLDSQTLGAGTFSVDELIGKWVYTTETELSTEGYAEASPDWNNIGEVSDVIMSADGQTKSILLDIGGFLGLGEHTVAVNMSQLNFVRDGDGQGDYFIVVKATKEELENAPAFDMSQVGLNVEGEEVREASATQVEEETTNKTD